MSDRMPIGPNDSERWNARFAEPGYAYGDQPNDFLQAACSSMAPGDALTLCEGEGRNAVYLAKLGFRVTAVDFSEVGLRKANELAAAHGVAVTTLFADLADFDPGIGKWDLVVAIFAQPPSATRQRIYGRLQHCLRPGGAFVLETKVEVGATAQDRYPGAAILKGEIAPLEIRIVNEQDRQLNEGRYHSGIQRTVQIVAINPRFALPS